MNAPRTLRHALALVALLLGALLAALPAAAPALADDAKRAASAGGSEAESRGRAMQRRVYDSIPADDPWLKMSEEQVFAQIWTRPGLSLRDKRLVSLTAAAYAASPAGYISHIEGALDNGDLTPAELWEWLIHFTQYAGYPKAAPVWAEIRIALAKRGVLPLPASLGPGRDPELDRERAKPRPEAPPKAEPPQRP
jgi:alkylhydroperoxidase/carboxymuconolactone decarboxylase family protein YurZ